MVRPLLQPSAHRRLNLENKRRNSLCCVAVTSCVLLLLFGIFGFSGWGIYKHKYDFTEQRYHDGDQIPLAQASKDFSTLFCTAYNVTLNDPANVYLLPHSAVINSSEKVVEQFSVVETQTHRYTTREFYLLNGSHITAIACRDKRDKHLTSKLIFIKGKANLDEWRRNPDCHDCIFKSALIPVDALCPNQTQFSTGISIKTNISARSTSQLNLKSSIDTSTTQLNSGLNIDRGSFNINYRNNEFTGLPIEFRASIEQSDHYAIVATYDHDKDSRRRHEEGNDVIIHVTLTRTRFELRDLKANCSIKARNHTDNEFYYNNSCEFNLPWDSDYDVVVDFSADVKKEYNGDTDSLIRFRTKCKIRVHFFVAIFAGIPLVLSAPICLALYWYMCRKSNRGFQDSMKRLSSESEVKIHDEAYLVHNQVVQKEKDDNCMGIQDD